MNKQQLAAKIWESANKMRSKIEANEYKDYILGFIFYKYLSDQELKFLKDNGYTSEDIELLIEDSFNQSYPQRNHLPVKRKVISFSVWSLIKDAIGKDLSKITFPAYINEPLSMTQRLCENFQYHSLL